MTEILAAVIGFIAAILVSRNSSFITAVTTERSKWIDKLRENIAELVSTCSAIRLMHKQDPSEALIKQEKADRLIAVIIMQLNPENEIDKNMIDLLPNLITSVEVDEDGYRGLEKQFICHAQFLLKKEWEKVKTEAMGEIWAILKKRARKEKELLVKYRSFAKSAT